MSSTPRHIYDIAIIGTGIVGSAIAREITLFLSCAGDHQKTVSSFWDNNQTQYTCGGVVILERGEQPVCGASKGNSAILHTGFDSLSGSLEQKLVVEGYKRFKQLLSCNSIAKIPYKEIGAIMVAWTEEELRQLPLIVARAHKNQCFNVKEINRNKLFYLEPNLSRSALGALLIEGECVVDSWIPCIAFLHQAINNGAKLLLKSEVTSGRLVTLRVCSPVTSELRYWELQTSQNQQINARIVINCAGTHGDVVETNVRRILQPRFTIRPRKGQFVVLKAPKRNEKPILYHMTLPVPTDRTKGILVYPSVYGNVVIGPTAEDQTDRDIAITEDKTTAMLLEHGRRVFPQLSIDQSNVLGSYVGIRPATQFKDYIIDVDSFDQWCTVAGIRSTGLSASLGIAAYVWKLLIETFVFLKEKCPFVVLGGTHLPELPKDIQFKRWPEIVPLLKEFVKIDGKTVYKVGHPLTVFGWKNMSDENILTSSARL